MPETVTVTTTPQQTITVAGQEQQQGNGQQSNVPPAGTTGVTQQQQQQPPAPTIDATAAIQQQLAIEAQTKATLEAKGIKWDALEKEIKNTGELSQDTYAQLEKAGFPRAMVDGYANGVKATAQMLYNEVVGHVGGQQEFDNIATFIRGQGDAFMKAYNDTVAGGNPAAIKLALDGIKARMVATNGTTNRTIMGSGTQTSGAEGFASVADMTAAINDKRYTRDPIYTREVEARIHKSNLF